MPIAYLELIIFIEANGQMRQNSSNLLVENRKNSDRATASVHFVVRTGVFAGSLFLILHAIKQKTHY